RLPVPPGDPGRVGHQLPAPGAVGPQGHGALGARAAARDHGVDGAPRHGPRVRRPLPQRGVLRRREEAQRDPPDGHPRARGGDPGRDRLGPRHRRAEGRRRRRPRGAPRPARAGRARHHPLPAPARPPPPRPGAHPRRRPDRRERRPRAGRAARARGLRELAHDHRGDSAVTTTPAVDPLDVARIRKDFPILDRQVHGRRLVYLDSANTSQKPRSVIEAVQTYYERSNANVHRGTYLIAEEATAALEGARAKVARFIGARSEREVVFTKNATEALNLVAKAWGRAHLRPGDPVVLTELEHHANIVPWHQLVEEIGIELRWIPVRPDGHLDLTDLDRLVDGAKVVSFAATSNVLGTMLPVERLVAAAHAAGAIAVVDASQHVPHSPTDVAAWGADFVAFTGHKVCGPPGIGTLWGTETILDATPPFLTGGEMILNVTKEGFTPNELPWKFEAGTPPIAEAVGLGAAVDYLSALGMEAVREHEVSLTGYALRSLTERFGDDLRIHGPSEPSERGGVLSFSYRDVHPHDLTQVFDQHGVCVRAGH